MLTRILRDERGTSAIEYALIASLISTLIIVALMTMSVSLSGFFTAISNAFSSAHV
jgi:pilus assembly protein Flp/PilA